MSSISLAFLAALVALPMSAQASPIEQGRAAINRGDSDAAIELLEKSIAQGPPSAEAHFQLGRAYLSKVQQLGMMSAMTYGPKAKGEFERAVTLDPKHLEARLGLVQFYAAAPAMMGGSPEKALEQAEAIKAIDGLYGHRAYSFIHSQLKEPELAKKEYLDAIREQPKSPKPHSYFGQYLVNVEKSYAAAFAEFETALRLDPSYMPAYYHLGRTAALGSGNLARGEGSLKKYLAYTPKENEPTLASAHSYLGAIYEKEGKKTEAKRSYEAALKLNPTLKDASEGLKRVS